jgi:cytidine deaminase
MFDEKEDTELYNLLVAMRLEEGISVAREAREHGVHYNGFKVGGSALAVRRNEEHFLAGSNMKPVKGGPIRQCAEVCIFKLAEMGGYERLDYLVTYANPKSDDWTGRDFGVLIMCGPCRRYTYRRYLRQRSRLITPYTPIISVNALNGRHRTFMLGELLDECGDHISGRRPACAHTS